MKNANLLKTKDKQLIKYNLQCVMKDGLITQPQINAINIQLQQAAQVQVQPQLPLLLVLPDINLILMVNAFNIHIPTLVLLQLLIVHQDIIGMELIVLLPHHKIMEPITLVLVTLDTIIMAQPV